MKGTWAATMSNFTLIHDLQHESPAQRPRSFLGCGPSWEQLLCFKNVRPVSQNADHSWRWKGLGVENSNFLLWLVMKNCSLVDICDDFDDRVVVAMWYSLVYASLSLAIDVIELGVLFIWPEQQQPLTTTVMWVQRRWAGWASAETVNCFRARESFELLAACDVTGKAAFHSNKKPATRSQRHQTWAPNSNASLPTTHTHPLMKTTTGNAFISCIFLTKILT